MLRIDSAEFFEAAADAVPAAPRALPAPLPERSAYAPSRRHELPAALVSAAAVAGLLAGLVWMHAPPVSHRATRLLVLDLQTLPPPPPPRQATKIQPRVAPHQPQPISAPTPIVAPPAPVAAPAPAAAAAPIDAGDLSSRMLSAKPPAYPLDSRRKLEQGTVVLTVLLGTDGRVADIAVAQSSGFDRLDQAALSAVRQWRWSPVVRDGAPVAVQGRVKIPFVLKH